MEKEFDFSVIDGIVDELGTEQSAIIGILQSINEHYRYLPKEIFPHLSKIMSISQASIYSVATFYEDFSLEPKGKYIIKVCDGTACHVRKSIPILEKLRKELNLFDDNITTEDLGFTVETVSCLGACGLAPVITVNDKVYPAMTPEKVVELLMELKEGM